MRRLKISIDDYTTPSPLTAALDTPVPDLVAAMNRDGIRHIPILEGDRAVGIVSDRDTRVVQNLPGVESLVARDIMAREPFIVRQGASLEDVVLAMARQRIGSAIVTERGKVAGIFTSTDALNALVEVLRGDVP